MRKLMSTLVSAALLGFVGTAQGVEVTIDPGAYTGQWVVDYGPARQGPATVNLGAADPVTGGHVISISGAELYFSVSASGRVSVITSGAAKAAKKGSKLTFNTTTVAVDPGFFGGEWRVTQGATPNLIGPQTMTLVAGLQHYNMKLGANGGFTFHLATDGTVTVKNTLAGTGGSGTLTFNNTERFVTSQ